MSGPLIGDLSRDELESLAHEYRRDYLEYIKETDPEAYLKGCVGRDEFLAGMMAREAKYENM